MPAGRQGPQKSNPLLVIAEWQCKCDKMMDIVWIMDNPWHAIASSFVYNMQVSDRKNYFEFVKNIAMLKSYAICLDK